MGSRSSRVMVRSRAPRTQAARSLMVARSQRVSFVLDILGAIFSANLYPWTALLVLLVAGSCHLTARWKAPFRMSLLC
jgi:hypothetical protein